jgi:hypothetical protein
MLAAHVPAWDALITSYCKKGSYMYENPPVHTTSRRMHKCDIRLPSDCHTTTRVPHHTPTHFILSLISLLTLLFPTAHKPTPRIPSWCPRLPAHSVHIQALRVRYVASTRPLEGRPVLPESRFSAMCASILAHLLCEWRKCGCES